MVKPFMKDGNSLKKKIGLANWAEHSTIINNLFAIIFWEYIIFLVYIIVK